MLLLGCSVNLSFAATRRDILKEVKKIYRAAESLTEKVDFYRQSHYFYPNLLKWGFMERDMRIGSIIRAGADEFLLKCLKYVEELVKEIDEEIDSNRILRNTNVGPELVSTKILQIPLLGDLDDGEVDIQQRKNIRFIVGKLVELICYVGFVPIRASKSVEEFDVFLPELHMEGTSKWTLLVSTEEAITRFISEVRELNEDDVEGNSNLPDIEESDSEESESCSIDDKEEQESDSEDGGMTALFVRKLSLSPFGEFASDTDEKIIIVDDNFRVLTEFENEIRKEFFLDENAKLLLFEYETMMTPSDNPYKNILIWNNEIIHERISVIEYLHFFVLPARGS